LRENRLGGRMTMPPSRKRHKDPEAAVNQHADTQPGAKAALSAFLTGFVICLLVGAVNAALQKQPASAAWLDVLLTSLIAGVVLAIGGAIAGRLLGAILGGLLGIIPAVAIALQFPVTEERLTDDTPLELAGPTLDGKTFNLADYRGKVVLVDFWGSWCVPCRAEMPHIKAAYQKYKDQGFEVVGVNIGDSRQELEEFRRDNEMSWPQIFFNEPSKQKDNPLAREHEVIHLPTTLLIDQKGRLVGRDLSGKTIEDIVSRVLEHEGRFYRVGVNVPVLLLTVAVGAFAGAAVGAWLQRRLFPGVSPPASLGQAA